MDLHVSDVRYTPASADDARFGLLGYVSFALGSGLRVDGVTLRRTADGRLALSFPAKRDRRGKERPYLRPVSREARASIEAQVLAAIPREEVATWL